MENREIQKAGLAPLPAVGFAPVPDHFSASLNITQISPDIAVIFRTSAMSV
jgi:hypothetical protein